MRPLFTNLSAFSRTWKSISRALTPCGNHSVYNGGGEEIMTTKVEDWTRWQGSGLGGGGTRGGREGRSDMLKSQARQTWLMEG